MTAQQAMELSKKPEMDSIFRDIERAARKGETHAHIHFSAINDAQIAELKKLGYTVTWYDSQEYSGGYNIYFGALPPKDSTWWERTFGFKNEHRV